MTHFPDRLLDFPAFPPPALVPGVRGPRRGSRAGHRGRRHRVRGGGAYDGTWNVVFATTRGNCSSGYSVPFQVAGNRVSSAGGGRVSGTVNRGGAVAVNVSVGASKASGGGRLAGASGAGSWSGIISGDQCSGTWQATRYFRLIFVVPEPRQAR